MAKMIYCVPDESINWHSEDIAIPFRITVTMPERPSGRGYPSEFIQQIASERL